MLNANFDTKGLYEKACSGKILGFIGIDSSYEAPSNPNVVCNTEVETPEQSAEKILQKLESLNFIPLNS